uniref:Uncharacterized protein n=1 Tax=Oryza barthii TaxID=65489 RepID=A0A0D3HD69_9ORYZ
MIKRDQIVRSKSIEVDLTSNLPRMFGPDVADRVIAEIQKAFGVEPALPYSHFTNVLLANGQ